LPGSTCYDDVKIEDNQPQNASTKLVEEPQEYDYPTSGLVIAVPRGGAAILTTLKGSFFEVDLINVN
jgi:hypothetical protein